MSKRSAKPNETVGPSAWAFLTAALVAACSFQKFDYLQDGSGGSGGSSFAGTAGNPSGGDGGSSGETSAGGSASGSAGDGGTAGAFAGSGGGDGGTGGTPPVGGSGGTDSTGGSAGTAGSGGTGAVGELVNPSFETTNTFGWTVEPVEVATNRYAWVQTAQGSATVVHGAYQFSTWDDLEAFTVELFQNVTGLEDGTYTFKGYFARGPGFTSVQLFARNCGGAEVTPVDVPQTEATQWLAVSVTGIEVVGGSCEVGLAIDSNPNNWLNADLFSFELESEPE